MVIDNTFNYDEQYFRMVSVALAKTLSKGIRWINRFTDKKIRVIVPFYLSMGGNERFLFDAFVDDIVDKRVELNTDQIPRGVITLNSIATVGDEFANPNQYLAKNVKIDNQFRKIISKTKAIPIKINYDISIVIDTEIDAYRVQEKILKVLFNYFFFNIDYFGLKIDAVLSLPDDKEIKIEREQNLESDSKKYVNFSLEVKSYYPDFYIESDDYETCDNDSEIDWDSLGILPPSERKIENTKKVFWENYIYKMDNEPDKNDTLRKNTPKENF